MSFASDTPILSAPGIRNPPARGRWLLWPAWCWRVLTPDLAERRMDPFTRVVARLCQAGVSEPAEMADLTRLHRDLCRQIRLMLQQQGLVTRDGSLTARGAAAVAGDAWDTSVLQLVHVFQHPFGSPSAQRLWPATAQALEYAHVDYGPGSRPRLRLDSRRDSPPIDPVLTRARGLGRPRRPSPDEIIMAARRARTAGLADASRPADEENGSATESLQAASQIARVSLVADEPDPVLLITCLYLPEDAVTSADWEALDPFSGWPDAWLKESLLERAPEDVTLAALIAEVEGGLSDAGAASRKAEITRLRAEAGARAERRLGARIREPGYRNILKLLTYVEASLAEARLLDGIGGRHRQAAVNDAGKVLEEVFATLLAQYPLNPGRVAILRLDDPESQRKVLEAGRSLAADQLGLNQPLPDGLLKQSGDQVARAAQGRLPSFRAALVAALLASTDHAGHPLRVAARERPDLCMRLDQAAGLRNESAHHRDHEPTPDEADNVCELAYWAVSRLLLQPATNEGQ
jgi:hypothetical protein